MSIDKNWKDYLGEENQLTPNNINENNEPWTDGSDGWNQDYFYDLLNALDDAARLQYEIKNARRGSYALGGDSIEDVASYVSDLIDQLNEVMEQLR